MAYLIISSESDKRFFPGQFLDYPVVAKHMEIAVMFGQLRYHRVVADYLSEISQAIDVVMSYLREDDGDEMSNPLLITQVIPALMLIL
jgi:hypothetical protein